MYMLLAESVPEQRKVACLAAKEGGFFATRVTRSLGYSPYNKEHTSPRDLTLEQMKILGRTKVRALRNEKKQTCTIKYDKCSIQFVIRASYHLKF